MAGIATTTAGLTLAIREHHDEQGISTAEGDVTENERMAITIAVVESARLFAGGDAAYPVSHEVARDLMYDLNALPTDEWWAYEFILHPTCWVSVHHRL